ncbi:MAG: hypothetical protein WHX52_12785 [Anaerolineae bacterium]
MKSKLLLSILAISLLLLVNVDAVLADPPVGTTPVIDGTIGADWADRTTLYPGGTWLVDDPSNDSLWGADNEIHDIYINWDANNLYFGVDFSADSNGVLLYVDFGDAAGITDFLGTAAGGSYTGAWPRRVSFPATNGVDLFYGGWNGANGNIYRANGSTASTDITAQCGGPLAANQGGRRFHVEFSCPWSELGFTAPVYPGGGVPTINVIAAIVGGDNYGGGDAVPDATITGSDPFPIVVAATHFAKAGVGPNATTLTSLAGNAPIAVSLVSGVALLGAVITMRRKRR